MSSIWAVSLKYIMQPEPNIAKTIANIVKDMETSFQFVSMSLKKKTQVKCDHLEHTKTESYRLPCYWFQCISYTRLP